jgi:hypothetical protein
MGMATATCAHCGNQFTVPTHSNQHRRKKGRDIASTRYCCPAHRVAAHRARHARSPQDSPQQAFAGPSSACNGCKQPDVLASVTNAPLAPIRQRKTALGIVSIVPDALWPGMYRLSFPDGHLSDMVNQTRAGDALARMKDVAE